MSLFSPQPVKLSAEMRRVRAIPRRELADEEQAQPWIEEYTSRFALAGAVSKGMAVNWPQAVSLHEATANPCGALFQLPVGTGKTLTAEWLPLVIAAESKRLGRPVKAVLITDASLKTKTFKDRQSFKGVWRIAAPPPRIITREELALEQNALLLQEIDPDILILDECDGLSNFDASAPQKIHRFLYPQALQKPGQKTPVRRPGKRCFAMTGTLSRRSIMNYWHTLVWCLGDGTPVPLIRAEAETWAGVIDDAAPRGGWRPKPGALGDSLDAARTWYLERLASTPGVVLIDEDSAAHVPLTIHVELAPECPALTEAFDQLRMFWKSPGGEPVTDTLSLLRLEGQLGTGLYTYFDPPPPQAWAEARSDLAKFIRARIAATRHAYKPLDTGAQVMRAHPSHPVVAAWKAIKDTYDPKAHARVEWLSTVTLEWCKGWLLREDEPSVLWCGGVEFGERLARELKVPYYGPRGREARTGRELTDAKPVGRDSHIVCSWHANKRGFNLQGWARQGIVQPPQSSKYVEQIIGRGHRQGQKNGVHFTWLATSGGTLDSFTAMMREAAFVRDTSKLTQKILRAEIADIPLPPPSLRWATKDED